MNTYFKRLIFIFLFCPSMSFATPISSTLTGLPTSDGFGWVTAISGKHALVAAPFADTQSPTTGTVFVYREASLNNWVADGSLITTDLYTNDQFGHSLALDGNTAVVGAPFQDALFTDEGAAYIFTRDPNTGTWQQSQKITPPFNQTGNQFGKSVAIDGNTLLISAWHAKSTVWDVGQAYIYTKDILTNQWVYQQTLAPADATKSQRFGTSLSIKGRLAVVGSYWNTVDTYSKAGSAYVFEKDPYSQVWAQTSKLVAADHYANNFFGGGVDTNGQVIVVGARENGAAAVQAGSVYVFSKNQAGLWAQKAQLTASDAQFNDRFGRWVSITGNIIYAGALRTDYNGLTDAGSVYRFDYNQSLGQWVESYQFTPANASSGDHIGARLDADGKRIIIGAGFGHGTPAVTGNAYIYTFNGIDRLSFSEQKQLGSTPSVKQTHATIATLDSGVSMSSWTEDSGIWFRLFDATGIPLFPEKKISGTAFEDNYPDIVAYKSNYFIISWQGTTPRGHEIFYTIIDKNGNTTSAPRSITHDVSYAINNVLEPMHPDVAVLPNGDALIVWDTIELSISHVYVRKIDNTGLTSSPIFRLDHNQHQLTTVNKWDWGIPDIDTNQKGDVIISWGGQYDIYGQVGITYKAFNIANQNWLTKPVEWLTSPIQSNMQNAARSMVSINNNGDIAATWVVQDNAAQKRFSYLKIFQKTNSTWGSDILLVFTDNGISSDEGNKPIPYIFDGKRTYVSWTSTTNGKKNIIAQLFNISSTTPILTINMSDQMNQAQEERIAMALVTSSQQNALTMNFVYERTTGLQTSQFRRMLFFFK